MQTIYGLLLPEFQGKKTLRQTLNLGNLGVTQNSALKCPVIKKTTFFFPSDFESVFA